LKGYGKGWVLTSLKETKLRRKIFSIDWKKKIKREKKVYSAVERVVRREKIKCSPPNHVWR
jgi:hypothetical protein